MSHVVMNIMKEMKWEINKGLVAPHSGQIVISADLRGQAEPSVSTGDRRA